MFHWDYAYPLEPIDVRTTQWMMPTALRYCGPACLHPTNHVRTLRVGWPFHTMLEVSACSEADQSVRRQRKWKVMCEQTIGRVRSALPAFDWASTFSRTRRS